MQIETWRCWSEPDYIRRILAEMGRQKGRTQELRSASYQVKRAEPVQAAG